MDFRYIDSGSYKWDYASQPYIWLRFHRCQYKGHDTFDWNMLRWMDNQSLQYIPGDKLEDFLYSSVHKSTQLGHWFPCIDCSVHKVMDGKDSEQLELKVIVFIVPGSNWILSDRNMHTSHRLTLHQGISFETRRTSTHWYVRDNFTNCILCASFKWAWIDAFASQASLIPRTVRVQNAFRSTTNIGISLIFR